MATVSSKRGVEGWPLAGWPCVPLKLYPHRSGDTTSSLSWFQAPTASWSLASQREIETMRKSSGETGRATLLSVGTHFLVPVSY